MGRIFYCCNTIAQIVKTDQSDILVYRIAYPIYAVIGIGLTILVFANPQEKIVQAKTHTIQIRFMDALKEVAKNKYFWIISLAGWLGFLELAYYNILYYNQNYGKTVSPALYGTAWIIIGNASFWGMIAAPFFVKRFGKKAVLITVNLMNVVCILLMLINVKSFWWLVICIWLNYLFSAFEQITTPAIQADIRDYQQYKSGERIDGMFAAVATIGNLVTLFTAAVIPAFQEKYGIYEGNGYEKSFDILFVDSGEPGLLWKFLPALIIMCAVGAFLNVVPYFFYDFTEKKQKSVIRVLKVRSLFEDYSNNALDSEQIVEAIELVDNARKMAAEQPKSTAKTYRELKGAARKSAKKAYKEALSFNEEIEIAQFVCDELDKFDSALGRHKLEVYSEIHSRGLDFIKAIDFAAVAAEMREAKALPKATREEKEFRKFRIQLCKDKRAAKRAYDKFYGTVNEFKSPDMDALIALFDKEDELDKEIFDLAKNQNDKAGAKALSAEKKDVQKKAKALMDEFARFNRAAKPYNDAEKFLKQYENYSHFDEIEALYENAKAETIAAENTEETTEQIPNE
jgi:hypothetical protein